MLSREGLLKGGAIDGLKQGCGGNRPGFDVFGWVLDESSSCVSILVVWLGTVDLFQESVWPLWLALPPLRKTQKKQCVRLLKRPSMGYRKAREAMYKDGSRSHGMVSVIGMN